MANSKKSRGYGMDDYRNVGVADFYSHSGKFSPLFILTAPIAFVGALLMAFVYNWMVIHIPIIGYFSVILTLGYAFAVGAVLAVCINVFKVLDSTPRCDKYVDKGCQPRYIP